MADVQEVRSMMVALFGDVAKSIRRTCDLIPLFYAEEIIKRVMTLVLRGRSREEFLTEQSMEEVFLAYACVIKSEDDDLMEESFERTSELRWYLAASRKVLVNAVTIEELVEVGNDLLKGLADGSFIESASDVDDEISLSSYTSLDQKTEKSETNDTLSSSDHDDEEPVTQDNPPSRKYSEEWRKDFFRKKRIPISTGITDDDIDILSKPTRKTARGYVECNPAYMAKMLRYSKTTLVNCCRDVCKSVLPHRNNLDMENREDAVVYYNGLSNDANDRIYAMYKCTSHQGSKFNYPTFECVLCGGMHFHNHCMKYLTLEMRINQMILHNICQQCGKKNCRTINCHEEGTWTCKNCHSTKSQNHAPSMCNADSRWNKGTTSTDGYHDLYMFANDMATIARATLFWEDQDWIEVHHSTVNFFLHQWKEYQETAAFFYHAMNAKFRAAMDKAGFKAGVRYPDWGDEKVLTERPPSRAAMSHSSESNILRNQLSTAIPKPILAHRLLPGCTSFVAVGVRALLLSEKLSDKLLEEHETSNPILKLLKKLTGFFSELSRDECFQLNMYTVLREFEGQSRCNFYESPLSDMENTKDAGHFITDLLRYLVSLDMDMINPSKLFCTTVTIKSQCGSKCNVTPSGLENVTSFTTVLEDCYQTKLTNVLRSLFVAPYEDGKCSECQKQRLSTYTLMELAHVFVVRINRMKLSNNKWVWIETQLIVEKEVVLEADTQKRTANLQTILCGNIKEAVNGRVQITRTFLINNNKWYSFENDTVEEVDGKLAIEYVQKHGVIFIFRKSEHF